MTTEKGIKEYYNQWHSTKGEKAWRPYESYPVFLDYLSVKPDSKFKLLDIGCGTGYLLKEADKRGLVTYGIDISEKGVEIAKKVSPNSEIIVGKGEDLPFQNCYFDYIVCLGVMEHFLEMETGLREMIRVAKEKSLFCITVPNSNFIYWKLKGYKGTEQRNINENLKSLSDWKMLFTRHHLEILKIYKDKWFLKYSSLFKKNLHRLFCFLVPLDYTYQFVFIMRKGFKSGQ